MPEIRTVTTLTAKRDEIERAIRGYEAALTQAHADLTAINATIACFQRIDNGAPVPAYFDLHRLFKRGEMVALARDAMAAGPLSTTELAEHIVRAKGLDAGDHVLRKAIAFRLVHALRLAEHAGKIAGAGKRKGVRVWRL